MKRNRQGGTSSYQNIVRFDVGVHDVTLLQEIQREEELFGVYPDSSNVQPNILAKTLNDVPEIHAIGSLVKIFCLESGAE